MSFPAERSVAARGEGNPGGKTGSDPATWVPFPHSGFAAVRRGWHWAL